MLDNLKTQKDIIDQGDVLGGGGLFESGIYDMAIELAYYDQTANGAISVSFHFVDKNGRKLRTTEYVTSGNEKGNKNYYEKDGKKFYLPGFNLVNNICMLTVQKELGDVIHEEKAIKIWSSKEKKEVVTNKHVLTELLGKQIQLGILKQKDFKNEKDATGKWVPTAETRESNVLSKVFRISDGLTYTEINGGITTPDFRESWRKKNEGQVNDKTQGKTPVAPKPPANSANNILGGNSDTPITAAKDIFG